MNRLVKRAVSLGQEPRATLRWWKESLERRLLQSELIRAAKRRLSPRLLDGDPGFEVHVLVGGSRIGDCMWALESLYRYVGPVPLVIHDDGTLTQEHIRLFTEFFHGCRVITRAEADDVILCEFGHRNLPQCASFRRRNVVGLKIFDLQYFAMGRRVLFLDVDILFMEHPKELIDALGASAEAWTERYNLDIQDWYAWPRALLERCTGIPIPPLVNSGLMVIQRTDLDWTFYERCLVDAGPPLSDHHAEQTLWALDFGRFGGQPLPARYDVHHRFAWEGADRDEALKKRWHGRPVISQHYSGGWKYRSMFYDILRKEFF